MIKIFKQGQKFRKKGMQIVQKFYHFFKKDTHLFRYNTLKHNLLQIETHISEIAVSIL